MSPRRPARRGPARLAAPLAACVLALALPAAAAAAPVVVLGRDGRVRVHQDRFVPDATPVAPPTSAAAFAAGRAAGASAARSSAGPRALDRLWRRGAIDGVERADRLASWNAARATLRRLSGRRRAELGAVVANTAAIAAAGRLTASRLEPVFLTLDRNRQWWPIGRLVLYGERVGFQGSGLIWQSYPGQGLQLQMLANFGKANGLWQARINGELRDLLDELVPLAARRGRGIAWEYYFRFGGGVPPWTSAMSQGTAVQALARAARRLKDRTYLAVARRALPIFSESPPVGVRLRVRRGAWYLLYSYAPRQLVLNGFLQALIGLYDFSKLGPDAHAGRLFRAGDRVARRSLRRYDTGSWSLYEPGVRSDYSYHVLVRDFLRGLCSRTAARPYCAMADRFTSYISRASRARR